jgi:hypothetical protein
MTTSQAKSTGIIALAAIAFAFAMFAFSAAGVVRADNNPVFLTRNNSVMSTYPSTGAFSVGTSTPTGTPQAQIGKLSVTVGASETWQKLFQVASTTGIGTATSTKDVFSITRAGCINTVATSTATPVKLIFLAVATTSSNGFVTWAYGSCSS